MPIAVRISRVTKAFDGVSATCWEIAMPHAIRGRAPFRIGYGLGFTPPVFQAGGHISTKICSSTAVAGSCSS